LKVRGEYFGDVESVWVASAGGQLMIERIDGMGCGLIDEFEAINH